jgi:hypothetical protein
LKQIFLALFEGLEGICAILLENTRLAHTWQACCSKRISIRFDERAQRIESLKMRWLAI